jgi:antitoxin (DNA-binding transcriptional repressor) of toxin-antitoxin stability system
MSIVDVLPVQAHLSRLVQQIETGAEREIIITRDGQPVARLAPLASAKPKFPKRLGSAEGRYATYSQEEFDAVNYIVAALFNGEA